MKRRRLHLASDLNIDYRLLKTNTNTIERRGKREIITPVPRQCYQTKTILLHGHRGRSETIT